MKRFKYMLVAIMGVLMLQGCMSKSFKSQSLQDVVMIVDQHLETVKPEEILVLFDINYTLTHLPQKPMSLVKAYSDVWAQEMRTLPKDKQDLVLSWDVKNNPNIILDPKALEVLADLRNKGVKIIALTAALAGDFDGKGPMNQHVYGELKSLRISFEDSFPQVKDVEFTDMPKYHMGHPMYYKGILFSNGEASGLSKGDVLVHFLKHIGYTPKVVIIADDRKDNITGLEKALAKAYPDMQLEGVEYLYAFSLPVPNISKDEFRKHLQSIKAVALA
jgi:hypothetical protein